MYTDVTALMEQLELLEKEYIRFLMMTESIPERAAGLVARRTHPRTMLREMDQFKSEALGRY